MLEDFLVLVSVDFEDLTKKFNKYPTLMIEDEASVIKRRKSTE